MTLYHFTDTVRLPWILKSGELRPGKNQLGGFPDPDFLWATTSPVGDRSATCSGGLCAELYRAGKTRLVRFTLREDDFTRWRDIVRVFPAWTAKHVARLERVAKDSPAAWWCRAEPLPSSRWVGIETRSYAFAGWRPLTDAEVISAPDGALGVIAEGRRFFSRQHEAAREGATAYTMLDVAG
jgi:hypothetical protein